MLLGSRFKIVFVSFLMLAVLSCGKKHKGGEGTPQGNSSDRGLMLTNIADSIVIPAYANFDVQLAAMITASDAFRANPTLTTLTDFRSAWRQAYIEWQKVAIFDFGPAADNGLNSYMNIFPANVTTINANIAAGNASLETFASYPAQGFPAFDYLLNGLAATDAAILDLYTTDVDAAKRLAYVLQLTNQMTAKFSAVKTAWDTTYRNTFVSNTSMDIYSSTSIMVNGVIKYYERNIRSGKFGYPSGVMVGGVVSPEKVEALYAKDLGLTLAQASHDAFVNYFNGLAIKSGVAGASLKTYLNSLDAKDATTQILLSETINTQFAVITDKLNVLTEDLSNEVSTNNTAMIAVYNEMQLLVRLLKVDMASAMSVTITYTDNDGD
jgi:hypothetical protein